MSNLTRVQPGEEEYLDVKYLISLCLGSTATKNVIVSSIANPHVGVQFERRSKDLLTLTSVIQTCDLDEANTIQEVVKRGISIRDGAGVRFPVGKLGELKSGHHQVLICKIAVGRSFVISEEDEKMDLPAGYDSITIKEDEEDDANEYYREYLIQDPAQILPVYVAEFDYHPEEGLGAAPLCDNCNRAPAIVYCEADHCNFCEECDMAVHKQAVFARHTRRPLDSIRFGSMHSNLKALKDSIGDNLVYHCECPHHPNKFCEYYCPTCQIPVCVDCKMVGHHSSGKWNDHRLVLISTAYDTALISSRKEDPLVTERISWLRDRLEEIQSKEKEVTVNQQEVEDHIHSLVSSALHNLRELVNVKLSVLESEETELRRELQQLAWTEAYLKEQQEILPPVDFLNSWNRHATLRSDILTTQRLVPRAAQEVKADLQLVGEVEILTEAFSQANLENNNNNNLDGNPAESDDTSIANGHIDAILGSPFKKSFAQQQIDNPMNNVASTLDPSSMWESVMKAE